MQIFFITAVALYILSSTAYFCYLFFQKDNIHRMAAFLLSAGFTIHTISIGVSFYTAGHIPVSNLAETLSMSAWAISGIFMLLTYRLKLKILGVYTAPLVVFIMMAAFLQPKSPVTNNEVFKSFWLVLHILTVFPGDAALALACGAGILYLMQERAIKTKKTGFFFKRLPSLELLDRTGYSCVISGFTLLTMGLISGMIYAKLLWGRFWAWDPKEIWSAVTWVFYAVLLHERLAVGWRGRRTAIMAIIGFGVLVFTFFGVNFFLSGHHSQFTK